MKKNDFILAGSVVVCALHILFVYRTFFVKKGPAVRIHVGNAVLGEFPLDEDCEIEIGDTNRLKISDGKADMIWADCPDQICVQEKAAFETGDLIVCLPNQVVVEVISGDERTMDSVAQ